jgi:enoyl-CoA hydratase
MALCSDLLLVEDRVKIGYPPARVWGVPTTAMWVQRLGLQRAKRLLFTGDSLRGSEAVEWGLALEAAPLEWLDDRFNELLQRIAQVPVNQLMMHKLMLNQSALSPGHSSDQTLATVLDGIARHTPEGYAFQHQAMDQGFKEAVRARDEPFGDCGRDPE